MIEDELIALAVYAGAAVIAFGLYVWSKYVRSKFRALRCVRRRPQLR
jgi:hypothetical protein